MDCKFNYPFHDFFIEGAWNLEKIKEYFGDSPDILTSVLEGKNCPIDIITLLLKQGADVNCQNKLGRSPLLMAVGGSNSTHEVIRVLLEAGADVNRVDGCKRTPLLKYLQRKDCSVAIVELLLDYEADVNHKDEDGDSILITAIRHVKDEAVIQVLVERGAEVNDLIQIHITPLLVWLRHRNSADIVKLLLAKGAAADIKCVEQCGCTPLKTALEKGRNKEVVQALLEYGADVNAVTNNGVSPLRTALENSRGVKIIQMLLEAGADVNTLDSSGRPPHCIALRHSSNDVVKLMFEAGSPPYVCRYHRSVLHCATDYSHSGLREDILKLLLETNVDVNAVDDGQSVLCFALQHGAKASDIQLLMDVGATLNSCNEHSSPLICATDCMLRTPMREDVVKLLLDKGACVGEEDLYILVDALRFWNYEVGAIHLLLDLPGMDTYVASNKTLLHHAVWNPQLKLQVIKLLLSRKAQVHTEDLNGDSPLHCAVRSGSPSRPSVISLLLQNGCPVNTKNKSGETPLVLAFNQHCRDSFIFKKLLIGGAHVEETASYRGYTLLQFLARSEYQLSSYPETPVYDMLVKFFFLQNPKYGIDKLQEASHRSYCFKKLKIFVENCLQELHKMNLMQIGNGHTFREFVSGKPSGVNYELGQVLEDISVPKEKNEIQEDISKNAFPVFLDVIFSRFPVFHDVIFARVKKLMVEQNYCPNSLSVGKYKLDCVILGKIASYSSEGDFLRFILASYRPVKVEDNSSSFVPGKRSFEASTEPNKYIKLYH